MTSLPDKAAQRRALRAARAAHVHSLSPAQRAAAQSALVKRLLPQLSSGKRIALYMAVGDEISAAGLMAHAKDHAWRLGLPRVAGDGVMHFHLWQEAAPLEKGLAGIAQPCADAPGLTPDVILLPLVGADLCGHRLGQGAGYYDRALAALHAEGHRPLTIGLAWDVQIWEAIAHQPHDVPLDALCTPTRWIRCTAEGDAGAQIV